MDARRLQQGGQGFVVLPGQHFCRGHEGGLHPVLNDAVAQSRRHGSFAAAHVPLNQAVHRGIPHHIPEALLDGPALGPGGGKGQQPEKALAVVPGQAQLVLHPGPAFQREQPQLQHQQFLKHQPPPGNIQELHGAGKVDILQGEPQLAQGVFLPHFRGQGVPKDFRQQGKGRLDRIADLPGGKPFRLGVHRHHRGRPLGRGKLRGGHLPAGKIPLDLPPEQVGFPLPEHGLDIGVVEVGQGHIPLAVGDFRFIEGHALADALLPGPGQHRGLNDGHLSQNGLVNGNRLAPILIDPGIQPQQGPHRRRADFPEEGRALFPHSL